MRQRLPLTALRAFEAAARRESFRAAAEELSLTPSAVSHQVRGLEALLGTALFQRGHRQVRVTEAGRALMAATQSAFDQIAETLEALAAPPARPRLRIHAAPSFAAQWLAPRLPAFIADHPAIAVQLAASAEAVDFASGAADVDILYVPKTPPAPGLEVIPLGEETIAPLCAPAIAARIARPADLAAERLIESEHNAVRWPDWFAANGLGPPPSGGPAYDRSFLAIAAAADALGVALESTRLAARELASGRLVQPLAGRAADIAVAAHALVFPPASAARPEVIAFAAWLADGLGLGPPAVPAA